MPPDSKDSPFTRATVIDVAAKPAQSGDARVGEHHNGTQSGAGDDPLSPYRFGQKSADNSQTRHEQPRDEAAAKSFVTNDNFSIDQSVSAAFDSVGVLSSKDGHGNSYRSSGADLAIRSKDGSQTYIKKGDLQEMATDNSEQLYNTATLDATYRDRATGTELLSSKAAQTFAMRTAHGGETLVSLNNDSPIGTAIGRQLRYDKEHQPQLIENADTAGLKSQIVVGQGDGGQTKVTVHAQDGGIERVGDRYTILGLGGVPASKDDQGLTRAELEQRIQELPASLRAKIKFSGDDVVFNGVLIHRDGYEHDRTSVNRDRLSGRIESTTLNADNQGHTERDVIDKHGSRVELVGVLKTEVADGKAVTTDAKNHSVATYDYKDGSFTTNGATFKKDGTDVKFAKAHVHADKGTVSSQDGENSNGHDKPALAAAISKAADASAGAQALIAAASSANAQSGIQGSLNSRLASLNDLRGYCEANGFADALQYLDPTIAAVGGALGISPESSPA